MANCNQLGDYGIGNLVKTCPNIEHLDLSMIESLTEFGLKAFVQDLKSVKYLDLTGIATVTRTLVEEWSQQRP